VAFFVGKFYVSDLFASGASGASCICLNFFPSQFFSGMTSVDMDDALDVTLVLSVDVLVIVFQALNHQCLDRDDDDNDGMRTLLLAVPAVCRRWRRICKHVMPSVSLSFQRWGTPATDRGVLAVAHRFKLVHSLSLRHNFCITSSGRAFLAEFYPNSNRIDRFFSHNMDSTTSITRSGYFSKWVTWCTASLVVKSGLESVLHNLFSGSLMHRLVSAELEPDDSSGFWAALLETCPKLVHLDVSGCDWVTDSVIAVVVESFPNLAHLDISDCRAVTDSGLAFVAAHCRNLTRLIMRQCQGVTSAGISLVLCQCHTLVYVDVYTCYVATSFHDHVATPMAVTQQPFLKHIRLVGCSWVSNTFATSFLSACHCLEYLNLQCCTNVTDVSLTVIGANCPRLLHIDLTKCWKVSDDGIGKLAVGCPNLTFVGLCKCEKVSDVGLMSLAQNCHALLRVYVNRCVMITDVGIRSLVSGCPQLVHVKISGCELVTQAALHALGNGCHHLTRFFFSSAHAVTDAALCVLASGCPRLKVLNLSSTSKVTDRGLTWLAMQCPDLVGLYIGGCKGLTNVGLEALATHCPHLEVVAFTRCNEIDVDGLSSLAVKCSSLKRIHLENMWDFETYEVMQVARNSLKTSHPLVHFSASGDWGS
jgi:hypothetical protein